MDFFHQQDVARKYSKWMVFLFIVAVICVVAAITGMAFMIFAEQIINPQSPEEHDQAIQIVGGTGLVTLMIILLGSWLRCRSLRHGGGKAVAESLGGRCLAPGSDLTLKERRYLNIVEEMALASGIPVPPAYVLDDEPSINAFAAGNSPEDAVVAVTRGTLETLDRDELQGVIGHEFSHILNGDMTLNIRLMGYLYGITLIYMIGWFVLRASFSGSSSRDKKEGGAGVIALISLAAMVIGLIGLFFGNVIKAALSRQREYLADASAVQFTRNPQGIANALKKIGGFKAGDQKMKSLHAAEASHLFFSEFSASFWAGLFATHPPLQKRIARLDPNFNLELKAQLEELDKEARERITSGLTSGRTSVNTAGPSAGFASISDFNQAVKQAYVGAEGSLGQMLNEKRSGGSSRAVKKEDSDVVPAMRTILQVITNPLSASAYVLALLTDRKKPETAAAQKEIVAKVFEGGLVKDWLWLKEEVGNKSPAERLMYLKMAIPALRHLSLAQYKTLRHAIVEMIKADQVVDLNEFIIFSMVCRQLDIVFELAKPPKGTGQMTLGRFRAAVLVLSRVAYAGSDDPEAQKKAFRLGLERLKVADADILPMESCTNDAFKKALQKLDQMEIHWKREFLNACARVIEADGVVTQKEAFLRYGIAAALGIYA
ncbi:MAG: M48 family metallopeptidase [Thermoguttaceae bacterium]|nr:M48 family metallopeptidase [Thermoguttaceae bacterium]